MPIIDLNILYIYMSIIQKPCNCDINIPLDVNRKLIPNSIEISHINEFIKCLNNQPSCIKYVISRFQEIIDLHKTMDLNDFLKYFKKDTLIYINDFLLSVNERLSIDKKTSISLTDINQLGGASRRNPHINKALPIVAATAVGSAVMGLLFKI